MTCQSMANEQEQDMAQDRQEASDLANLLCNHHDEIAALWAEEAHKLAGTRYSQRPLRELRASALRGVKAIVELLSTGSQQALEAYLEGVSMMRLQLDFEISEVIEALLLLKEAALPVIRQANPDDSQACYRMVAHLDACLRLVVGRFGYLHAEAMKTELRESEERFRTIADFTYDWAYWLDPDGNYVYVSPSCERITGYRADEFRKDPELLKAIIHSDDCAMVTEHLRGEPLEGSRAQLIEFRVITRSGAERWLEHACQPVYGFDGNYLGRRASNRDVTERRRAEEALKEQARERTVAAERSRLARELHDSVTQALYSMNLYAEATRMALSAGKQEVARENLQELHYMVREAIIDMRMLIFELHPPVLEKEGLVAALQARLAAVEARAGLQTKIVMEGERRLPLSIERELFWISVEAFNNIVKHAKAHQVEVRLQLDDGHVYLEIQDDGTGFELAEAKHSGGVGLRGMEERVRRIQGRLAITSAPGQGTTVRVQTGI
jgi:PAS domain S-box-containing protein